MLENVDFFVMFAGFISSVLVLISGFSAIMAKSESPLVTKSFGIYVIGLSLGMLCLWLLFKDVFAFAAVVGLALGCLCGLLVVMGILIYYMIKSRHGEMREKMSSMQYFFLFTLFIFLSCTVSSTVDFFDANFLTYHDDKGKGYSFEFAYVQNSDEAALFITDLSGEMVTVKVRNYESRWFLSNLKEETGLSIGNNDCVIMKFDKGRAILLVDKQAYQISSNSLKEWIIGYFKCFLE